jgi:release factor glutamine methyltransferase
VIYRGVKLSFCPNVYKPSDDSFLLADNIEVKEGGRVLDLGTGCGIFGIIASKLGGVVTSSDINDDAIKCARKNAKSNSVNITFVKSDLFENIKGEFDLIMFNPPYLPKEPNDKNDELKKAWDGGDIGIEVTQRFLGELKNHLSKEGKALMVQSSLSMPENTPDFFKKFGLFYKTVDERPFFFEKLYLYKVWC